jgi:3-deoxy-7-phosphoheptulonate synthase
MIVILKENYDKRQLEDLKAWLATKNVMVHVSEGLNHVILGLVGDTLTIDPDLIRALDIVSDVKRIQEPYKKANRKFHTEDTIVNVAGVKIGGGNYQMIAGPCSIESEDQICEIARAVKESGATILRGGAFKPRTSPYDFQGLKEEGLRLMLMAKEKTGLPIVTEIMDASHLELFENVDMIQVGARNMQNFELLKALGRVDKPILLKRGLSNTIQELLMSAEYIMDGGNNQIVLCERGIRTFETATRNTLDVSVVPLLKELTHLPIFVDPSHGTGLAKLVPPLSMAATIAGADGVIVEVHNDPAHALCDGPQSITPKEFEQLSKRLKELLPLAWKRGM